MVDTKQFQINQESETPKITEKLSLPTERETVAPREDLKVAEIEKGAPSSGIAAPSTSQVQQPVFTPQSQIRREIESVLEDDLDFLYKSLSPKQRQQFRIEGEKTAAKIEILLKQTIVKIVEVIKLIRNWLLLLPGIDRFFLEQEAKIKAEKMVLIREDGETEEKN